MANSTIFNPAGIDGILSNLIWEDPSYGMGNPSTLQVWIQALTENLVNGEFVLPTPMIGTTNVLGQYFGLTKGQLQSMLSGKINSAYNASAMAFAKEYKCSSQYLCQGYELAALQ